jgi:hypothetical protein
LISKAEVLLLKVPLAGLLDVANQLSVVSPSGWEPAVVNKLPIAGFEKYKKASAGIANSSF